MVLVHWNACTHYCIAYSVVSVIRHDRGCPYDCICYYTAGMLDSCLCDARMASWLCIYHLETMRCVMQAEQLSLAFLLQLPHGTEWAFM